MNLHAFATCGVFKTEMIYKITKRSHIGRSAWLADVRTREWHTISPPPRDDLGIQSIDFVSQLDGESAARQIQDRFLDLAPAAVTLADRLGIDGELAAIIHRTLDGITSREAGDADMWAYMVSFGCPQYPRWRWSNSSADLANRYAGSIRRNAFAALWWWADVSHDPEKAINDQARYEETRQISGRTSFVLFCVDCAFSGHHELVRRLCALQRAERLNDRECKRLCRSVNRIARVACLDSIVDDAVINSFSQRAYSMSQLLR